VKPMSILSKTRIVAAVFVLASMILCAPHPANAQITRLAENMGYVGSPPFLSFDLPSDGGAGGDLFYSDRITVPANANTLLIDFTGTTAEFCNDGAGEFFAAFTCLIDGNLCVPQGEVDFDDAPRGWITLNALSVEATFCDPLFNTVHMTWCIPPGRYTTGGTMHTIVLKMASGNDESVLLQQARVNIDAVQVSDTSAACTGKGFIAQPLIGP
jgi:hypothetical protein